MAFSGTIRMFLTLVHKYLKILSWTHVTQGSGIQTKYLLSFWNNNYTAIQWSTNSLNKLKPRNTYCNVYTLNFFINQSTLLMLLYVMLFLTFLLCKTRNKMSVPMKIIALVQVRFEEMVGLKTSENCKGTCLWRCAFSLTL